MGEISEKGHKASTHSPRGLVRPDVAAVEVDVATLDEDASSLRAEQWSVHWGDGRSVLEGSKCEHLLQAAQRGVDGGVT